MIIFLVNVNILFDNVIFFKFLCIQRKKKIYRFGTISQVDKNNNIHESVSIVG